MKSSSPTKFNLSSVWIPLIVSAVFASTVEVGYSQNTAQIRSITTLPARLTQGTPFVIVVKLSGNASAVKGEWNSRHIVFWKGRDKPGNGEVWYVLAGVDVETAPGTSSLSVEAGSPQKKESTASIPLLVNSASYRTTTLKVPANFVEPDAATRQLIAADKEIKDRVFAQSSPQPDWSGDFIRPVNAASTDSFGTRRTFNGKLASIHRGMDFRAPSGTPVTASNSGRIVLARKLFYEGNCVVIDHGQGFMTLYMHLSRIEVAEGSEIRKGQPLGLSGATGRVTGPHLHFAARWQGAYLDPAGLFRLGLAGMP